VYLKTKVGIKAGKRAVTEEVHLLLASGGNSHIEKIEALVRNCGKNKLL